jgi:hypothetical protein
MEETKREVAKEEMCACHNASMSCGGSAHRYCFKRCCVLRCFAVVIVLGLVFAAGACVGGERHERGEWGGYGYSRHRMMMEGEWGMMNGQNYQYLNPSSGRVIMMQRAVSVPTTVVATTSTTK